MATSHKDSCKIYMHGGNIFTGILEYVDSEWVYVFTENGADDICCTAHSRIAINHIEKIEFTGPRASKGLEFIGLERH